MKKFAQRTYEKGQIIDLFSISSLWGDHLREWAEKAQIGDRYERFTGQTYLERIA